MPVLVYKEDSKKQLLILISRVWEIQMYVAWHLTGRDRVLTTRRITTRGMGHAFVGPGTSRYKQFYP